MGFLSKLLGKKDTTQSKTGGMEDYMTLVRVYFQAVLATRLGINNLAMLPDLRTYKQTFRVPTLNNKLGPGEKASVRKIMKNIYNVDDNFFDEKWQDLVESFLAEEGKIEEIPHVYSFHQDIISFLEDSSENNDQDLESYTRNFGQAGLSKLSQLSSWEKYLVQEVAIYNLSTRFYIQSEKEKLEPLSELVFHQNQDVNLVNVYRVANNLSDRISRDIEEFLLMVDSKELKKEVLEIHFEEKEGDVLAYLGSELMATLDTVTDLVQHEENYTQLPLTQKLKIITHFDEVKAIREKSNQVEEVLSPSSDIEQETEETNSFSNVDKIVEEALREYPIGSQVSYKGQVFQLVSIENAQLNDLIRLELLNDSKQLFEENPILYLNSLEEIEQVLSRVELEKEDSEIEIDSSSESQEIDLFSYLEEENEKDKDKAPCLFKILVT